MIAPDLSCCTWDPWPSAETYGIFSCSIWTLSCPLKVKVAQSCPTLCDTIDYTVHGILQATILEWVAFPFSKGSAWPRDRTQVSHITGRGFLSAEPQGKPRERRGTDNTGVKEHLCLSKTLPPLSCCGFTHTAQLHMTLRPPFSQAVTSHSKSSPPAPRIAVTSLYPSAYRGGHSSPLLLVPSWPHSTLPIPLGTVFPSSHSDAKQPAPSDRSLAAASNEASPQSWSEGPRSAQVRGHPLLWAWGKQEKVGQWRCLQVGVSEIHTRFPLFSCEQGGSDCARH